MMQSAYAENTGGKQHRWIYLRSDAAGAFALVQRRLGTLFLASAVLVAGGILAFAVNHLIVG
jgi:hypothetical protein